MTMREKLIEVADRVAEYDGADINTDCPGSDRVTNWPAVIEAILAALSEPDAEMVEAMARAVADWLIQDRGEYDFGYDSNPDFWRASCRDAARGVLAATINHVRSGK